MTDLRQRRVPSAETDEQQQESPATGSKEKKQRKKGSGHNGSAGINLLDIIRVLVTLVVASCGLSYYMTSSESLLWGYRPWFTRWPLVVRYIVSSFGPFLPILDIIQPPDTYPDGYRKGPST